MKKIISPIKEPTLTYTFLQSKDEIAFFDIETTGLSPNASSLYLIGLMYFDNSKKEWTLCQWFANNYHSEKEMIIDFLETLSTFRYLIHFNGKTFDIPYILKKCKRYAISIPKHCNNLLLDSSGNFSIDLLSKIRSLRHALLLDKCNQTAIECWLGLDRTDIFSGKDLIPVYSEYMQQKIICPENSSKLEQVLLLHNHDDIEMMLELCSLLTYDEYLSANCKKRLLSPENLQELSVTILDDSCIQITLPLPMPVPKEIHLFGTYPSPSNTYAEPNDIDTVPVTLYQNTQAQLTLKNTTATLTIPVYHGSLKFFFPNYKDYYYLPKEDMAVHKSVAEFVDSTYRKKATAATCYVTKEGTFLPSLSITSWKQNTAQPKCDSSSLNKDLTDDSRENSTYFITTELFFFQYKDKLSFYQLPENHDKNADFWKYYLSLQFPMFR